MREESEQSIARGARPMRDLAGSAGRMSEARREGDRSVDLTVERLIAGTTEAQAEPGPQRAAAA